MAKGFLKGVLWGGVASVLGAATLSISVPRPGSGVAEAPAQVTAAAQRSVQAPEPDAAPAAPEPSRAETAETANRDVAGTRPAIDSSVTPLVAPQDGLAAPDAPGAIGLDTASLDAPDIGDAPQAPSDAPDQSAAAEVAVVSDAPVAAGAQAAGPDAPDPEADLVVSTDPAQPPQPAIPADDSPLAAPDAAQAPEAEPDATAALDAAPPVPQLEGELPLDPGAEGTLRPAIGRPAVSLVDRNANGDAGGLPRIGTAVVAEPGAAEPGDAAQPGDTPLQRFATKVDAANDLPRMSIVLIDDGSGPLGPEALEAFPFPVTFAIDPAHPTATETSREYRKLGFEVMTLADVPEGAQASDVEIALAGALDAVPEAVAVLEDPAGGLQASRAIATQATAYLAESGHGLVMLPKGLNTAQQLAARDGVPSATLFRDFDSEGQDARVIRRFLDQAAFRSRQEGAVVMLGRLRADTVSALVLWGLQDKASTVALVPVSTVLRETIGEGG